MTPHSPTFESRVAVLGPLAYRVCFRILGDRQEAQDLTQEALARAYSRWARVADYDEAWITRVVTNLALGEVRRRGRADRQVRVAASGAPLDALVVQRAELVSVLRRLSRRQREVVAMRYLADLPEAQVAAALGCSVGTVKQHASRGLAALRDALDPSTSDCADESEPSNPASVPTSPMSPGPSEGAS
jgi:RNA polymerase sigma factor (sigma-70 family)